MVSSKYVDVHTHLTHDKFQDGIDALLSSLNQEMGAIICNGLEPKSNRKILEWAQTYSNIKPALGIYPINAVNHILPEDFELKVDRFDVDAEIKFIREKALSGSLIAIGECGLDGYWLDKETFSEQERVFEELINIAKLANIPIIIHTRKLEKRSIEILDHHDVRKVNFHCYGGKVKLALKSAEKEDWCFSIPANARRNQAFTKMLEQLPQEKILTETDAPYLSPSPGELNIPTNVKETVSYLAELRKWPLEKAIDLIWSNYQRLFNL